jgi:hypothetical protein
MGWPGEATARGTEGNIVTMPERGLSADSLVVDVGAVQAPEIAKNEVIAALLDDAVLFRDDLVEQLDRVVRVAP